VQKKAIIIITHYGNPYYKRFFGEISNNRIVGNFINEGIQEVSHIDLEEPPQFAVLSYADSEGTYRILLMHQWNDEEDNTKKVKILANKYCQGYEIFIKAHRNGGKVNKFDKFIKSIRNIEEFDNVLGDPSFDAIKAFIDSLNKKEEQIINAIRGLYKKFATLWRFEYFLELSQWLLALAEKNKDVQNEFNNIIDKLYPDAPEELKRELKKIIDITELKKFSGKTILDKEYASYYKCIYKRLKEFSQEEMSNWLREI